MTVFELEAKLGLNKEGFDKGVRDAEGSGKNLKDSLSNSFGKIKTAAKALLGAAIFKEIIDGIKSLVSEVAEVGDTIDKQSQVLGLSRKAYQEWDYILEQNGASIESLGASMRTLNSLFTSAKDGNEEANNALAQLGVNVHELELLNPEEQFEALVRAFQKMPAGAKKSALAVKVFGRSGTQLLPLLNQSSDSIDELRKRAEELGLIMSDDAVDAAVVYGDSLDDLKRTFNAFKYSIGAKLLPTLTGGIQKLTNYLSDLRKVYETKGLSGVVEKLVGDLRANWPTWEQIKSWVIEKWAGVIEGFKNIAKLVFGETEDGGIKWPTAQETWNKISETVKEWWGAIQELSNTIFKLIFGETADGGIKWPTPDEIKEGVKNGLRDMWAGIQTFAGTIMKLIFGEDKDGNIKWPTGEELFNKIKSGLSTLWNYIKGAATGILQFIFGEDKNGGIKWPTAPEIWKKIKGGLEALWGFIKSFAKGILKFVFGETADGGIKWPTPAELWEKIKEGFGKLWEGIKGYAKSVLKFWFGEDEDGNIAWPDVETLWGKIKEGFINLWNGIKEKISNVTELIFGENTVIGKGLKDAFEWCKNAIKDVKRFLGLPVEGELTSGDAEQMRFGYQSTMNNGDDLKESGWIDAFKSKLKDAGFEAGEIDTLVTGIVTAKDPEWVSQLITDLTDANKKAERLAELTAQIHNWQGFNKTEWINNYYGNKHAKGSWSIPTNDYPALLHRGEMVLTASQARKYKEGVSDFDMSGLVNSIIGAIREGMDGAQVNSYMDSTKVTNKTNNVTGNRLMARRFAPI